MIRLVFRLSAAAALALAALPASAASDPCAGGLAAAQIVDCLRPDGTGTATRGIRPPTAAPSGTTTASNAAEHPSVNLMVPFAYDSADLTPEGIRALAALTTALKDKALGAAHFEIAGHTDATGGDAYNKALSERRAEAARNYLVQNGVEPARLTAVGYGRSRLYDPAAPNAAVNRRVQVTRLD